MKYFLSRIIVLGLLLTSSVSQAALTINITQGVEGALPVAVVPFKWLGPGPLPATDVAAIVSADLYRSGRFSPLPDEDFLAYPYKKGQVNFKDWRLLGVDNLVIGRVKAVGESYVIEFQLFDVYGGEQITGYIIRAEKHELRYKAHQISDIIYEALTGTPGAFATRIAYVTHIKNAPSARRYSLQVADADGFNPQPVLNSKEPLMSPAWSPDGSRLAYVSFEDGRPSIYIQNVSTGQRELITSFTGINGAPSWSPDGKQLAVVLSKGGNPDIYTLDLATRRLKQRTRHYAIDTEPVWTRDGKGLIFTSDRGGRPQLYQLSFSSGKAKRLTFEGRYNARATVSPDGKNVAMVYADNGNFQIAVMELETGFLRVLTDAKLDESPSFSPNGSMIIYATVYGDRGILSAVSVDGRVRQRLMLQVGDAREPVWSPYHDAQ